jgi:hypothetical protein
VRNRTMLLIFFVSLVVGAIFVQVSRAAEEAATPTAMAPAPAMSKERELKLLQLEEAKLLREDALNLSQRTENDYEEIKKLYEKGYVSGYTLEDALRKWEQADAAFKTADLNLRRTKLSFLQDASRISVMTATQRINAAVQRVLDFTLKNTSNVSEAMVTDEDFERRDEFEDLLRIENIRVSVVHQGIQIGKPFEIEIPALGYGKEYGGSFILQQEKVEFVDLQIEYLNKVDTRTVYLEKQSGEDIPRVTSLQFAQEGNAGESVMFDLELERLAEDAATFALEVVGLPDYIRYRFEEEGKQLSKVKFPERVATRKLDLRCYVPEELAQEFLDQPIDFFAVVGNEEAVKKLAALAGEIAPEPITEKHIEDLKIGYEALQLIPRGRPEIQLAAPNLYFEIDPGEPLSVRIVVRNTGTVTLREVRLETEKPYDWTTVINPELLDKIEPKEEIPADIQVILPEDMGTGIYDMQVVAKCLHEGEPIESPKKDVRINVKSKVNLLGTVIIVMVLVIAMLGVAVFTIRLARR